MTNTVPVLIEELEKVETDKKVKGRNHVRCNDCGRFLHKSRWVRKDHPRYAHALCLNCLHQYDDPYDY